MPVECGANELIPSAISGMSLVASQNFENEFQESSAVSNYDLRGTVNSNYAVSLAHTESTFEDNSSQLVPSPLPSHNLVDVVIGPQHFDLLKLIGEVRKITTIFPFFNRLLHQGCFWQSDFGG